MTAATPAVEPGVEPSVLPLEEQPWPEIELPPTQEELPYDDGAKMESPWHVDNSALIKASYIAFRGGELTDFYVGTNMFVYFSMQQVRNQDYRGPDVFIAKDVDGQRVRLSWVSWEENGRYPDVIFELLSPSTEKNDLDTKKKLYERVFHTSEYFCVAPQVERLLGWRLDRRTYVLLEPDARGWLWSEEMGLWVGAWRGRFMGREDTWLRFYHPDGSLVLLPEEAERQRAENEHQRAEAERQRADDLAARLTAMEAELRRLRGEEPPVNPAGE